jgi:hypothetical protein
MQRVIGTDVLVRIQVVPALAAILGRASVPGEWQRLQTAARQRDEILLQRHHPERVLNLEVSRLAIGACRTHDVIITAPGKAGFSIKIIERRVLKVAENRGAVGVLHRKVMMRTLPVRELGGVTVAACVAAHKSGLRVLIRILFGQDRIITRRQQAYAADRN